MKTTNPQLHSRDAYLRLNVKQLHAIELSHLFTELIEQESDEMISVGVTEWIGQHENNTVSLAWDWRLDHNNSIEPNFFHSPRSNVMLICGDGYDLGIHETTQLLLDIIARIPWCAQVLECVRALHHLRIATPSVLMPVNDSTYVS